MRVMRAQQPETWVESGLHYFDKLSPLERKARMPRVLGHQEWTPDEVDKLRTLDNRSATKELGRTLSSIANARQRFKVSTSFGCLPMQILLLCVAESEKVSGPICVRIANVRHGEHETPEEQSLGATSCSA